MADFRKGLGQVRKALRKGVSPSSEHHQPPATPDLAMFPAAQISELAFRFARELEAVGGHRVEVSSQTELFEKIVNICAALKVQRVAITEGISIDLDKLEVALKNNGLSVLRPLALSDWDRARVREELANCDLGIVEADYGIAATGTLALSAAATRPRSVSLLPPINVVILRTERILPDLAETIRAIGSDVNSSNSLTLVTGPSRTADIEKRIVLGVHGPKELFVILLWP